MTNNVKHLLWREGRPRWHPSPTLRSLGFKGMNLVDDDGDYLDFDGAVREANKLNARAAAALDAAGRRTVAVKKPKRPEVPLNAQGYVYFIWSGGRVKIGFSFDPFRRVAELRTGLATPIDKFLVLPGRRASEQKLHKRFEGDRSHREWFSPSRTFSEVIEEMFSRGTADLK